MGKTDINRCLLLLVGMIVSTSAFIKTFPARIYHDRFLKALNDNNMEVATPLSNVIPAVLSTTNNDIPSVAIQVREEDLVQSRDLDDILFERARRFYDPRAIDATREKCLLIAVDHNQGRPHQFGEQMEFSIGESLDELSELVGTAGLAVYGCIVQKLPVPHPTTYVGSGKISEIAYAINTTLAKTLVIDDDLSPKQQRNLESAFAREGIPDVKILDRTAVILEIFAQHATSREGQLQVELAMLEYRMTRGPSARGGDESGAGFRGPGESKVETDKRVIKDKILLVKRELSTLGGQRQQHRNGRNKLNLPVVALVGYTNAGKSTLMNRLSKAGVLAENMLFATLDPTTRKVQLPRKINKHKSSSHDDDEKNKRGHKGQEVLLTDTVGFISKLPTNLIAAFRATLEEVTLADVLVLVVDRSSPVWEKQRMTVLKELAALGCQNTPLVEVWNKIDQLPDPDEVMLEAATIPIDVDAFANLTADGDESSNALTLNQHKIEEVAGDRYDDGNQVLEWNEGDEYVREVLSETVVKESQEDETLKSKFISDPSKRKHYTVAASAKSGVGMDDFVSTLSDALSLFLVPVTAIIPYSKDDGIIDQIYQQGVVEQLDYLDEGTKIFCSIPEHFLFRLKPFLVPT